MLATEGSAVAETQQSLPQTSAQALAPAPLQAPALSLTAVLAALPPRLL